MTEEDIDENKDSLEESGSVETETGDDATEVAEHMPSKVSNVQDEYVNPRGVRFMPQEPAREGNYCSVEQIVGPAPVRGVVHVLHLNFKAWYVANLEGSCFVVGISTGRQLFPPPIL